MTVRPRPKSPKSWSKKTWLSRKTTTTCSASGETLMGDAPVESGEAPQVEDHEGSAPPAPSPSRKTSAVFDNSAESAASVQVDDAASEDIEATAASMVPVGDDEGEVVNPRRWRWWWRRHRR